MRKWITFYLFLFAPIPLAAQLDSGTILGTVIDGSGAVVPGVKISVRNQGTSAVSEAVTGSDGNFVIPVTAVQNRGQQMRHVLKTWDLGRGSGV